MNNVGRLLASGATVVLLFTSHQGSYVVAQDTAENRLASRVDPYVEKQRIVVMTDIANEPDESRTTAARRSRRIAG